jgi:hypothetical protein
MDYEQTLEHSIKIERRGDRTIYRAEEERGKYDLWIDCVDGRWTVQFTSDTGSGGIIEDDIADRYAAVQIALLFIASCGGRLSVND